MNWCSFYPFNYAVTIACHCQENTQKLPTSKRTPYLIILLIGGNLCFYLIDVVKYPRFY